MATANFRDFRHASKIFTTNFYQNSPKFKYLFHVYFDINPDAWQQNTSTGSNFGLLVKTASLPVFSFNNFDMNQYNRKRIVQTKVKYDPVNITFHDDNRNLINTLWIKYFTYYYNDTLKPEFTLAGEAGQQVGSKTADYNKRNIYQENVTGDMDWGYNGNAKSATGPSSTKIPFFKNITIFGFEHHNYTAYTLINPIITRFAHDTFSYAEGTGTMENTMTLNYETVVYNTGQIDGSDPGKIATGFGDPATYDRLLSPLATKDSIKNKLSAAGTGASDIVAAYNAGDYQGALSKAGVTLNSYGTNLLQGEITPAIRNAISQTLNDALNNTRQKLFDTPVYGQTPVTGQVNQGQNIAFDYDAAEPAAGRTLSGASVTGIGS